MRTAVRRGAGACACVCLHVVCVFLCCVRAQAESCTQDTAVVAAAASRAEEVAAAKAKADPSLAAVSALVVPDSAPRRMAAARGRYRGELAFPNAAVGVVVSRCVLPVAHASVVENAAQSESGALRIQLRWRYQRWIRASAVGGGVAVTACLVGASSDFVVRIIANAETTIGAATMAVAQAVRAAALPVMAVAGGESIHYNDVILVTPHGCGSTNSISAAFPLVPRYSPRYGSTAVVWKRMSWPRALHAMGPRDAVLRIEFSSAALACLIDAASDHGQRALDDALGRPAACSSLGQVREMGCRAPIVA